MSWFEQVHATLLTSTYTSITADVNDEVTMEEETEETQQYYGTKMSSAYVHFALSIFFVVVVGGKGGGVIGVLSLMNKFFGGVYMTGYKS